MNLINNLIITNLLKKLSTFFVLLAFIFIGFFHNSMMAFAMQNNMWAKMWMMQMNCKHSETNSCKKSCHSLDIKVKSTFINSNNDEKVLKIKLTSLIDIFSVSSKFLENKNLIKNTSPPNLNKKIKYYSYSDLVKIIKSNT